MQQPPPRPPPLPLRRPDALEYQPPLAQRAQGQPGSLRFLWLFIAGLFGGGAVSAVAWIGGWNAMDKVQSLQLLVWIIPATKLIAGTVLCCIRGWRGLGAGLLVSIALGFLIFFGTCAAHIK